MLKSHKMSFATLFQKRGFIASVFLTLIVQLFVTFLTVYFLRNRVGDVYKWYIILSIFLIMSGLIFAIVASNLSGSVKFILFTLYSVMFGIMLAPIALVNREVLLAASGGTIGVFVLMFIAGAILTSMKVDLSILGAILVACLIGLIVAGLMIVLFDVQRGYMAYLTIGLMVYALFVTFDTQQLLKKSNTNVMSSAMAFYLDIIGIFIRLAEIFARASR